MDITAVIGGSGRAGASTVVAELATALAARRERVAVLDADLGSGNVGALLGVPPEPSLGDVIAGRCTLVQALRAGASAVRGVAAGRWPDRAHSLALDERLRLIEQIEQVVARTDTLLIDAGTSVTPNTFFFTGLAHRVILVVTPEAEAGDKALATLTAVVARRPKASVHVLVNRARAPAEGRQAFSALASRVDPTLAAEIHYWGARPEVAARHAACWVAARGEPIDRDALAAPVLPAFPAAPVAGERPCHVSP
jgi:flagellar biosynthesis protein FlhG